MIALIVIGIVASVMLILLLTPVRLVLDTQKNEYSIAWGKMVKGWVNTSPGSEGLDLSVVFWRKHWAIGELVRPPSSEREDRDVLATDKRSEAKKTSKTRRTSRFANPGFLLKLLRSFRVRRFAVDLDTDNYMWNAMLYPLFMAMNWTGSECRINYQGRASLEVYIDNRPVNILLALMR